MANRRFLLPKRLTIGLLGVGAATLMAACGSAADTAADPTMPGGDTPAAGAPESDYSATPEAGDAATTGDTVVDVAASADDFSILVEAIEAADLTEALSSSGPITVFAPTNEAFEALPEGTLDELLLPENQDLLRQVLTYHVIQQEVPASDVTTGEVPTAAGAPIALMVDESTGEVTVNNARVTETDIQASNGIIHAVDQVILPPGLSL